MYEVILAVLQSNAHMSLDNPEHRERLARSMHYELRKWFMSLD